MGLLTKNFVAASGLLLANAMGFHLFVHLPGFFAARGSDESEIGLLFSVGALGALAARPLIGRTIDRHGRRPMMFGAGVLSCVATAAYLLVDAMGTLAFLARIGQGLSVAMMFAALMAYASDIIPEERRIEGLGVFGSAGALALSLAGLLGDAILARSSYRVLFTTALGFQVLALLLVFVLDERRAGPRGEPSRGVLAVAIDPQLLPLWTAGFLLSIGLTALGSFLKTFLPGPSAAGSALYSVGAFFTVYSLTAIAVRLGFGRLPNRLGPERTLRFAFGIAAAGMLLLALCDGPGWLLASAVCCGVGQGFAFPILMSLCVERCRPDERGATVSVFSALFDLGMLVGAPMLGLLIEGVGYRTMFLVCALSIGLGVISLRSRRLARDWCRTQRWRV